MLCQLCIELSSDLFYFVVSVCVRLILREVKSVRVCVFAFLCVRVRVYGHARAVGTQLFKRNY